MQSVPEMLGAAGLQLCNQHATALGGARSPLHVMTFACFGTMPSPRR